MKKSDGFTLLEILIALFIFTMLSMMLVGALHQVINIHEHTEANAERLRKLQLALLIFSRDIEQAVNQPIKKSNGKLGPAFMGAPQSCTFTQDGLADPLRYQWRENTLYRIAVHTRPLLTDVTSVQFSYLDNEGRFHRDWPVQGDTNQPLPRAVRVVLTISNWGNMSQLYVIPAQ